MKNSYGLLMIVILLVTASGCTTQQAAPAGTATTTTQVSPTDVPAVMSSPLPATVLTTVSATAAPTFTTNVTTVATPKPVMTASTKVTTIHIRNNTFVPAQLIVLPGTGITWINDDSVTHIVKAAGDAKGKFTSTEMITGAHFGYTFGEATGTYEFADPNYPDMKGAIIVKKGESLWSVSNTS